MNIKKKHYRTKITTIHPTFNVLGTNTQRNSCSSPNFQQLPTKGIFYSRVLECLSVPNDEEYLILNADFSQLEARLACNDYYQKNPQADPTKDPLYNLFNNNEGDFHSLTAFNVFAKGHKYNLTDITITYEDNTEETYLNEIYLASFENKVKNLKIGDTSIDKSKKIKDIKIINSFREVKNAKEESLLKGVEPFKSYRQKSKSVNFSLIYGASHITVYMLCIENKWSEEELDSYIKDNNLQEFLDTDINKNDKKPDNFRLSSYKLKGYVVAKDIRQKFLSSYPSLALRISLSEIYANKKGYCQSYYGYKRKLKKLKYFNADSDLGKKMFDEDYKHPYLTIEEKDYKKLITDLKHIAVNTDIQSVEMHKISMGFNEVVNFIKKYNLKSRFFNTVHDSVCMYVFIPEIKILYDKMREVFLRQNEEDIIKLDMEFSYSHLGLINKDIEEDNLEISKYLEYYENGRDFKDTYNSLINDGYIIYQSIEDLE